jgi:1-acyl-sn-glycerol-3-phosphate acyltransferase
MTATKTYKFARCLARTFTTIWFDLKVYGKENVPEEGGVLFVANHLSFLDPMLVGSQMRRPMSFLARSGLFDNPLFGWWIRQCNAFPVRQGEGDIGAVRETIRRLQEGHMLNIFPEGGRSSDGELQPIQPGVALIIRKAGVPILPVAIEGSFQAWPNSRKLFRPHPVRVLIGKPMHLHDRRPREIVQIIDDTLRSMIADLRQRVALARDTGSRHHSHACAGGKGC